VDSVLGRAFDFRFHVHVLKRAAEVLRQVFTDVRHRRELRGASPSHCCGRTETLQERSRQAWAETRHETQCQ
jgi:hypothetical protein